MAWRELHEVGPSTGAARPTVPQPGEPPGPCAPGWGPSCARPCEAVVRDMAKVWQGQNWVRVALGHTWEFSPLVKAARRRGSEVGDTADWQVGKATYGSPAKENVEVLICRTSQ